jgi:hypothetical protein
VSVKCVIKNFRRSVIWQDIRASILARSRSNAECAIKRLMIKAL